MNDRIRNSYSKKHQVAYLAWLLVLLFAFLFSVVVQPALASPAAQVTETATTTVTATVTNTTVATLPRPTGTSTALVPVTGADLTQPAEPTGLPLWPIVGLLGILLLVYGLTSRSKSSRPKG